MAGTAALPAGTGWLAGADVTRAAAAAVVAGLGSSEGPPDLTVLENRCDWMGACCCAGEAEGSDRGVWEGACGRLVRAPKEGK